jgi:hypothetical protein
LGLLGLERDPNLLVAHCGYLGVVPPSFSTEWTLRPKVLAIVNDNATAIDARLPEGPVTLAKLDPTLKTLTAVEGALESYVQFPNSHCLNGGVIRVPDGRKLLANLPSHHSVLLTGSQMENLEMLAKVFKLEVEKIQ